MAAGGGDVAVLARIFTIGHSNHEASPFLGLLAKYRIKSVIDVRSIPSSGRFPHFKKRNLENLLQRQGIRYRHCPELGNKEGGGIAHLLMQPDGQKALAELAAESDFERANLEGATAYMCAEADWRDCHRQVIAQRLVEDFNIITTHILRDGSLELHPRSHRLPVHYGVRKPERLRLTADYGGQQEVCCPADDSVPYASEVGPPPPVPFDPGPVGDPQALLQTPSIEAAPRAESGAAPASGGDGAGTAVASTGRARRWGRKAT